MMTTLTTLFSFNGTNGSSPRSRLILDAAGDLFGTTQLGGSGNGGTVFELVNNGSGGYTPSTLASFPAGTGANLGPFAGLIADSAGDLFGTTQQGGAYGLGSIFEIVKTGNTYASTPITLV